MTNTTRRGIASRIWSGMIAGAEARGRVEAARHLAWLPDDELAARGISRAEVDRWSRGL